MSPFFSLPATDIVQKAPIFQSGKAAPHGEFRFLSEILHLVKRQDQFLRQGCLEMLVVRDNQLDITNKS